ncbi:dual specificity mitogen-activated protein kinase kinase 6 isoform X2 [Hydra vulgaris]|uniref:mitogen-activated protein kinase kinase n=1 Tax=Hydra vulgaris TaxID=6087 RepID=A0ABM4CBJ6_HYDVU
MTGKRRPPHPVLTTPAPVTVTHEPPRNLSDHTSLTIDGQSYPCNANDLQLISELGRGAYGVVEKMKHVATGIEMAVKRIRHTVNSTEQRRLLMDLDVNMRLSNYPYTVHFYGALFKEGDVWICMQLMRTSLDHFYKIVSDRNQKIPEYVLKKVSFAVVSALEYLHKTLHVIHRDVKPSNILVNYDGEIKLCDFGISGHLVDSLAKTLSAGCKPYMAPERINPNKGDTGYDIRSDVWSLGITIVELASLQFPYSSWTTPFDQLQAVVNEPSPSLPSDGNYSDCFREFVDLCLKKNYRERPKYRDLLNHSFIVNHETIPQNEVTSFVQEILNQMDSR